MWRWLRVTILEPLKQERLVQVLLVLLVAIYVLVFTAGFWAPYSETFSDKEQSYAPPTPVFVLDEHKYPIWPEVVAYEKRFDAETYGFAFYPDYSKRYPIQLFVRGEPYHLFGVLKTDVHLFGVKAPGRLFLLGTDLLGQDVFSRLLYGGQISLSIGFLSLFIAVPIGLLYGGVSGYLGGWVDWCMMRVAEVIMCIPQFYLLLGLATLLPSGIPSNIRFSLVIAILAFIGWAPMARVIRGMVLSYKQEEYIDAARVMGAGNFRIITRHLLPQTASFVIVGITLGVPGYLLAESALSFLGLGIQPPAASWGNLLHEAQDLSNILQRPLLFIAPALLIFLTILAFNIIGDRLRDWLDPKMLKTGH